MAIQAEQVERSQSEIPSTIRHLSSAIACIGPITAQTAKEWGLPVHIVAEEYTIDGLVKALVEYYRSVNRDLGPETCAP